MAPDLKPATGRSPRRILQSLANWRACGYGPPYLPHIKGTGNKIYYRPDEVLAWLSAGDMEPWEFVTNRLGDRDLKVLPATRESTEWLAAETDAMFP